MKFVILQRETSKLVIISFDNLCQHQYHFSNYLQCVPQKCYAIFDSRFCLAALEKNWKTCDIVAEVDQADFMFRRYRDVFFFLK